MLGVFGSVVTAVDDVDGSKTEFDAFIVLILECPARKLRKVSSVFGVLARALVTGVDDVKVDERIKLPNPMCWYFLQHSGNSRYLRMNYPCLLVNYYLVRPQLDELNSSHGLYFPLPLGSPC